VDWEIKASLDMEHGLIGIKPSLAMGQGRVHKPDRLQDNLDVNYAVWIPWENLSAGANYLRQCIESKCQGQTAYPKYKAVKGSKWKLI
jgi:hypothetical protein